MKKLHMHPLLVFLAFLALGSCQNENFQNENVQEHFSSDVKMRYVSYADLLNNRKFTDEAKDAISKNFPVGSTNKDLFTNYFGVYIDTTKIVEIIRGGDLTLTMHVQSYSQSDTKHNLVLYSKNCVDSFIPFIAAYRQEDLAVMEAAGHIEDTKPTSIMDLETDSKLVAGPCATSVTHTVHLCRDANGNTQMDNGDLGNGCVGTPWDETYTVWTIDLNCMGGGGGGAGNPPSNFGGNGFYNTGVHGGSFPNINTNYVSCSDCLEMTEELADFITNLSSGELIGWNDLSFPSQRTIVNYLEANNYTSNVVALVKKIILAVAQNYTIYGYNFESQTISAEFVSNILYPELDDVSDEDTEENGPDCESFNFVQTGQNWQEAALTNIHFNIIILGPNGLGAFLVPFPTATLFGCKINPPAPNPSITPGRAGYLSAQALLMSMNQTINKYKGRKIPPMMIDTYFQEKAKKNHADKTKGGIINFNASSYSVVPTPYQTNFLGIGNCN